MILPLFGGDSFFVAFKLQKRFFGEWQIEIEKIVFKGLY
jgi:hypothetical protein